MFFAPAASRILNHPAHPLPVLAFTAWSPICIARFFCAIIGPPCEKLLLWLSSGPVDRRTVAIHQLHAAIRSQKQQDGKKAHADEHQLPVAGCKIFAKYQRE